MVKRKAEVSVDEWLERGAASAEVRRDNAATTEEAESLGLNPIAEEGPTEGKTELGTNTPADVAQPRDDNSKWFWALLESAGYERW